MSGKVLIACSNDECRANLLDLFAALRLAVHSVFEDPELLFQLLEENYCVVVYDLDLSGMNGYKIVRIIRKMKPRIPLIVISKNISMELGGKILQEGVVYLALKPLNRTAIRSFICKVLDYHQSLQKHIQTLIWR